MKYLKKTYILIAGILVSAVFPWTAAGSSKEVRAQEKENGISYTDAIEFTDRDLSKNGRSVSLSMNIILDSTRIRSQHTVTLTPAIVARDGSSEQEFGSIIIDGRARHIYFERKESLDRPDTSRSGAMAIIRRKNSKEQEYAYLSSIPYGRWMLDGKLEIREKVSGCAKCPEGESRKVLQEKVLPAFIPHWKTSRIEPAPEPVKTRAESRIARLQFAVDKSDIRPGMGNNRAMLDTVTGSIDLVKGKDYIMIKKIYVAGFASPEGSYEYNMALSSRRAESLAEYISGHSGISPDMLEVEWSGEDWEGLRNRIMDSGLDKKDTIAGIIDRYTEDRNLCETEMRKALTGEEYRWLLETIYPDLRYCTYKIEYEVRNFNLEEAKRIIRERPQDLGLKEIYAVAGSYGEGTEGYERAMEAASQYYRDSPAVISDLSVKAIEKGDPEKAIRIISNWIDAKGLPEENASELTNILGVAYAVNGEYGKAKETLENAENAGSGNARYNLGQLLGVTDQL